MSSSTRIAALSLVAALLAAGPASAGVPPSQACVYGKNVAAAKLAQCIGKARAGLFRAPGTCSGTTSEECYHDSTCPSGETCLKDSSEADARELDCEAKYFETWYALEDKAIAKGDPCPAYGESSPIRDAFEAAIATAQDLTDGIDDVNRVFVTSLQTGGSFGGMAGGDLLCQSTANAAGLGGTWIAWLSIDGIDARSRLSEGRYRLLNGTQIAASKAQFVDGSLAAPINVNEYAQYVLTTNVWTGTDENGFRAVENCSNWSSFDNAAVVGRSDANGASWTDHEVVSCGEANRLYCVEQ